MGFGGGGGGALPAHVHNAVPLQGGPLDFVNDTISSMNAGSTTFSNGLALQELAIGAAGQALVVNGLGTAPEWGSAGSAPELLQYRLPQETTETVVLNELYRLGSKHWKVTQIEKPILYEATDDSDLIAVNDDMTGYANDAEFDAVWISDDAANIAPSAANNRIYCSVPNGADATCYFDLGHTIDSNAVWSLSFSFQYTASGGGTKRGNFGLSSNTSSFNSVQSFIGFSIDDDPATGVASKVGVTSAENVSLNFGIGDGSFTTPSPVTDNVQRRYVLNGLGYGLFSCTMYEEMDYGTNNEEQTSTFYWTTNDGGAVTTGLRYLKINVWSANNGATPTWNFSDVQFTENDNSYHLCLPQG